MAETLDQYLANLKALASDLKKQAPDIAQTMAITGKSLVQERIQREGFGAEYSKKSIPTWWLKGKELNAGGRRFVEDAIADDEPVNWGEFRAAQGLQNNHVDLTYSGRMFGGLVALQTATSGTSFSVTLAGSDKEVDQKLGWNAERYGDFMKPNEAEQKEIDEIVQDAFDALIRKYFK